MFKSLKQFYVVCLLVLVASVVGLAAVLPSLEMGLSPLLMNLVVFAVGALLAVVFATVMAQSVTSVLNKMLLQIEAIAQGSPAEKLELKRKDEIGEFAAALNRMTNRDKAVKQANQDPLTGLANRRLLMQKLDAFMKAKRDVTLVYIDLDKFKPVNDTYGHEMGDETLKKVTELFQVCVRENDVLARIGGDEFVIVFNGLNDRAVIEERSKKIIELLSTPFWIGDVRIKLGGSLGIAIGPEDGDTAELLLNAADEAMYAVKKSGRNNFKFYS